MDVEGYRGALLSALSQCASPAERDRLLCEEAVEITRDVTDDIRDLVRYEAWDTL